MKLNKKITLLLCMVFAAMSVHANALINIYTKNNTSGYSIQYSTKQPINALYFSRYDDARDKWKIDDDYVHQISDDFDIYSRKDKVSFVKFQANFDLSTRMSSNYYDPIKVFSDGSSSIFTEFVTPKKVKTNKNIIDSAEVDYSFENSTPNGSVIINSTNKGKNLQNIHLSGNTYAYFGNVSIAEMENVSFVTDPIFPKKMSAQINSLIEEIIDYHRQVSTVKLGFKPIVFVSYHPSENGEDEISYAGDIINTQMHLTFDGNLEKLSELDLSYLVAHELAHFWNGTLFHNKGPAWLHEGGADYFANQALLSLHKIDQKTYDTKIEKSLNKCASRVGKYAISDTHNVRMIYNCGSFVNYTVDQLFGTGSAVRLWKVMFTNLQKNGETNYDESNWFEALNEISDNEKDKQRLINFITQPITQVDFIKDIQQLGWKVDKEWLSEKDNVDNLSIEMLKLLMMGDCDNHFSFNYDLKGKGVIFNITKNNTCKQFKLGVITKIDHQIIGTYSLYKNLQAKCKNGQEITITSDDNSSYSFICYKELRELMPELKINNYRSGLHNK